MVKSYHTFLPGEISLKWNPQHTFLPLFFPFRSRRKRQFTLSLLATMLIRQFGSSNSTLQRFIVHIVQPIALSGVLLFGRLLFKYPLGFIGVGLILLFCAIHVANSLQSEKHELENKVIPEDTFLREEPHRFDLRCDMISDVENHETKDNEGELGSQIESPMALKEIKRNVIDGGLTSTDVIDDRNMGIDFWQNSSEDGYSSYSDQSDSDSELEVAVIID
jgi:hypothetical protein